MARLFAVFVSVILLCTCTSNHTDIVDRFVKFINDFEKPYKTGTAEFFQRLEIFKHNLQQIDKLNEPYKNGTHVYGVTQFSDLSPEEFKAQYLNDLRPTQTRDTCTSMKFESEKSQAYARFPHQPKADPTIVDWREKGVVSPVKDQGQCKTSWAFAAAEVMESAYGIKYNVSAPLLSVQQLIDCTTKVGNHGCESGDICVAFSYIGEYGGITYESEYPLTNKDGTCHLQPGSKTVVHYYNCMLLVGFEDLFVDYLYTVGPVAAAIDATTWQNYKGGVIQYNCSSDLNHSVQVVGYNMTGPVPYYIVRNSWGTKFGMDGYLYVKIGGNLCGIATQVSDVFLKET